MKYEKSPVEYDRHDLERKDGGSVWMSESNDGDFDEALAKVERVMGAYDFEQKAYPLSSGDCRFYRKT
jgi:hypothetical protein